MPGAQDVVICRAEWPRDTHDARRLLHEYFQALQDNPQVPWTIRHKDRDPELESLGSLFSGSSVLLLAWQDRHPHGCVAVHMMPSRQYAAELKRLYVAPSARGCGLGRRLVQAATQSARDSGARELLLDTLPDAMPEAVRLYQSEGFSPIPRYNGNQGSSFAFYRLALE